MPQIDLITVGRMKSGPMKDLYDDYARRLVWRLRLTELDVRSGGAAREHDAIAQTLAPNIPIWMMDERGKNLPSPDFAARLEAAFHTHGGDLQIVIGGADGLSDELRKRATHLIAFGAATWPHMLARVMLVEQLYRAQTILSGHPYHRV